MNDWWSAEQRARRGMELAERGLAAGSVDELRHAVTLLREAIAVVPTDASWHAALGNALEGLGDLQGASRSFKNAWGIDGSDINVGVRLAAALVATGQMSKAVKVLDQVQAADPRLERAYCLRISALAALGRHEEAEETYYLARLCEERCPRCDIAIARSMLSRGRPGKALGLLERLTAAEAKLERGVPLLLARACRGAGRLAAAREHYAAAIAATPQNARALVEYGEVLEALGQGTEAMEKFRRALRASRNDATAHAAVARWHAVRGNVTHAVRHARLALRAEPELAGPRLIVARADLVAGKVSRARKHLRCELVLSRRANTAMLFELAALLELAEMPKTAGRVLRRLSRLCPGSGPVWQNLAINCFKRNDFEGGRRASLMAHELNPASDEIVYNLAVACARENRWDEARRWAQTAMEIRATEDTGRLLLRLRLLQWRERVRNVVQGFWRNR